MIAWQGTVIFSDGYENTGAGDADALGKAKSASTSPATKSVPCTSGSLAMNDGLGRTTASVAKT